MEALKLKIFDVLTEKINISEFENWLYNSEYLKQKIKGDSLFFNVININYKLENSILKLKEIASQVFTDEEFLVLKLERYCLKIINLDIAGSYKKLVLKIIENFDFDTDFKAYWDFYDFYHSFDGYDMCEYHNNSVKQIDFRTKKYAETIIEKLKLTKNIREKVILLKKEKEDDIEEKSKLTTNVMPQKTLKKQQKLTLKQKLFAFFKKI